MSSEDLRLKKDQVAIIRRSLVELTGSWRRALILNQFVFTSQTLWDADQYAEEEYQRAIQHENGVDKPALTHGWITRSYEDLSAELMLHVGKATIKPDVEYLVENGWLERRNHPTRKTERSYQYRVDILQIQFDLLAKGYVLDGYQFHPAILQLIRTILPKAEKPSNDAKTDFRTCTFEGETQPENVTREPRPEKSDLPRHDAKTDFRTWENSPSQSKGKFSNMEDKKPNMEDRFSNISFKEVSLSTDLEGNNNNNVAVVGEAVVQPEPMDDLPYLRPSEESWQESNIFEAVNESLGVHVDPKTVIQLLKQKGVTLDTVRNNARYIGAEQQWRISRGLEPYKNIVGAFRSAVTEDWEERDREAHARRMTQMQRPSHALNGRYEDLRLVPYFLQNECEQFCDYVAHRDASFFAAVQQACDWPEGRNMLRSGLEAIGSSLSLEVMDATTYGHEDDFEG